MDISSISVEQYDFDLTKEERKIVSIPRSSGWFKADRVILVNDKMQHNYMYVLSEDPGTNFDPKFKPYYTPSEMLELGVFEGKYCRDCQAEFPVEWFMQARLQRDFVNQNFFGVKSRSPLSEWKANGWIHEVDPRGWFQWYMRYYLGRRIPIYDDAQIKRWKSFARHQGQVIANCKPHDLACRPRQRQALLQWSYNPFI